MSFFGDFFSPKTNTQGTTANQSQSVNSGTTQSNLWPQLGGYFNNFASTAFNPQPFNGYQLGAANNQTGVAGGLGNAFNTANYGAAGGLYNPSSPQSWMSPYLNDVAASTVGVQGLQKAQDLNLMHGSQAKNFAFGNKTGADAAYFAGRAPYDTQAINQIYNQGFGQANQNAQTAASLGYQGAGLAGSLTGAATGANQALFGQGQTLWSDPMTWLSQGASALSPWTQAAGQNYSGTSSGTSTGQTNQTTTQNLSPWQILSGLGGLTLGGLDVYNNWGKADGGPVKGYALGGSVGSSSFADKVKMAHATLQEMHSGGRAGYDDGGWVPTISGPLGGPVSDDPYWDTIKQTAQDNRNSLGLRKLGDAFGQASKIGGSAPAGPNAMDALAKQQAALTQFMSQNNPLQYARGTGYALGGAPSWDAGPEGAPVFDAPVAASGLGAPTPFARGLERLGMGESGFAAPSSADWATPGLGEDGPSYLGAPREAAPPAAAPERGFLDNLGRAFRGSGYDYDAKPSPLSNLSRGLMAASGPLFAGNIATTLGEIEKERMARIAADQHWATLSGKLPGGGETLAAQQAMGEIGGRPTLQARTFTETQRQHDKPTWGVIGQDQYGVPQYGLIDVNKALPPRAGAPASPVPTPAVPAEQAPPMRDSAAPMGSRENPVYAASPDALAQLPPETWYTTPSAPVTPQQKGAPAGERSPVTPSATSNLPAGVVTSGPITANRGDANLVGDEFLKTLNPQDALKVKHIAEGLEPYPTGLAGRAGRGAFLAQAVTQYDPTFDVRNYAMRQKTLNSFKSGPIAEQIKAINTVPGHLGDLYDATEKLGNFAHMPMINAPYNAVRGQTSTDYQKAQAQFKASAAAVAAEMAKVFRASGMSRADFEDWSALLHPNASPEAIKGAIQKAVQLIDSRQDALKHQWSEGMGPAVPFTAIAPKAQAVFDKLRGGKQDDWGAGTGPTAPQVGEVRKGYKFIGGDPSSPASWEKAQ